MIWTVAAESHQSAHRMSVEWSRIQPTPHWDEAAIDHYREILRGMLERGLTPMVTLHHFSDPIWLSELGSWENENMPQFFEKYVGKVVDALKEYVSSWVTINEPNVLLTFAYVLGQFPPGKKDLLNAIRVATNMINSHAAAYHLIHKIQPQARWALPQITVGLCQPSPGFHQMSGSARLQSRLFNDLFPVALRDGVLRFPATVKRIPQAKNTQDFLGIDYYTCDHVSFNLFKRGKCLVEGFTPQMPT
jgi:beta-glucosidase